jgi:hypothetical protein
MAESFTAEELKTKRTNKLGKEFGNLYDNLMNETYWIQGKWYEFKELYAKDKKTIELLNNTAPDFFYIIQSVLIENIILGIARITDPEKSYGKKGRTNITIKAIPKFISNKKLKSRLEKHIQKIDSAASFCRDWRNRHITHKDYSLNLDHLNSVPLEIASREKIKIVLSKIHRFFSIIEKHYFGHGTSFELIPNLKGAIALIYHLNNSVKFNKMQFEEKVLKI